MNSKPIATYGLLLSVIIIWAIAWPVSKIGLMDMSPIWYAAARVWIGFITVFMILLAQRKIKLPTRRDLPLILSIGLLQMGCFLMLLNGGLLFVPAGQSAILVYSTPFLVAPFACLFFNEKLTPAKFLGLCLGLGGLLILFSPWNFNWHDSHIILGNFLLLLAAACWAVSMLHTRYGTWHSSPLTLIPWQLLIAGILVLIAALIVDPHPKVNSTTRLLMTVLYNGILSTGFAYPAIIYVSRKLPVVNTSVLLLGVPVLGLILSAWWLQESLTFYTLSAMSLIIAGLTLIATDKKEK